MTTPAPMWSVFRDAGSIRHAFFISHVNEDEEDVIRLKAEIEAQSARAGRSPLTCSLDVLNWPIANLSGAVIREELRRSAHMVAWVSPAYLATKRGWVWMELAYAELIELTMNQDHLDLEYPFIVPVYRKVTVKRLERTPWLDYWQRQVVAPNKDHSIPEIARRLVDFHEQEARKLAEGGR